MRVTSSLAVAVMAVGAALVGLGIYGSRTGASLQADSERQVVALQQQLDSVRASLANASTAEDSAGIQEAIRSREHYLGRRAYHLAARSGGRNPALIVGGAGIVLVLAGAGLFWHVRSRAA